MMETTELWPENVSGICEHIDNGIQTLNGLWEDMGLTRESMTKRMDLMEMHCQDIAKEELKLKLENLQNLRQQRLSIYWEYKAKDKFLSSLLGTDEYPPSGESEIPKSTYLGDLKKDLENKQTKQDSVEKLFIEKRSVIFN